MLLKEGREEIRLRNNITDQEDLVEVMGKVLVTNECRMQIEKNGTWISVQLSTVNGTEVGDQECRYTLFLHYGVYLPYPPPNKYDGCWAQLSIAHTLDC